MLACGFQASLGVGEFRTGGHLFRGQNTPEGAGGFAIGPCRRWQVTIHRQRSPRIDIACGELKLRLRELLQFHFLALSSQATPNNLPEHQSKTM